MATANLDQAEYNHARYRDIHALLIDYEGDHAKVQGETLAIERTLQENYSATTRYISIPTSGSKGLEEADEPEAFVTAEISEFKRIYSAPDVLLIVYYTGYSRDVIRSIGEPATRVRNQIARGNENSDILLILNSYSVDDGLLDLDSRKTEVTEVIYSSSAKPSQEPGSRDFANMVNACFRGMAGRPTFSAHDLCVNVKNRIAALFLNRSEGPAIFHLPMITVNRSIILTSFDKLGGPLGPLPQSWERVTDTNDHPSRQYYRNNATGLCYWTRPLSSVREKATGATWDQQRYVAHLVAHIGHNFADLSTSLAPGGSENGNADSPFSSGFSSFAEWVAQFNSPHGIMLAPRRMRARGFDREIPVMQFDF
ncbi:hypothetical protein L207DRAFT_586667 [Hyaloscypha variabilis F]|uniref:WW domain-containing protein n=1 Tax=Hyaloscypha variabilis (strain UAMH 11265 / GT02V1 / F) TaxID=1149755 RepID=A0A2J6REP7_HYAVF|nr:hypothetical protein L207DRAFT_586667 [Hyaloscypha variabilis F]